MKINLFTDGGCAPNPGCGGWAAILELPDKQTTPNRKAIYGFQEYATNNEMECVAIFQGMKQVKNPAETDLKIVSDSLWAINAISGVYHKVKANKDIVMQARVLAERFKSVEWVHVEAHKQHKENEDCDSLVALARQKRKTFEAFYY